MPWYVIRGQCCGAAHPGGCGSPLQIVMAVWCPFCLNSNFLGRGWQPSADNTVMVRQRAITICRGQEHPKGRKGTLRRHDFQANTRPRIFVKKPMSPQDTGIQLWGTRYTVVSLKQFRENEAWIQLGQESPLMNKKGLRARHCGEKNSRPV
jgi:hypothetical protein